MQIHTLVLAAAALALSPLAAAAQDTPPPEPEADLSQQFFTTWGEGKYLAAIVAIEDRWQGDEQLGSSYVQMRPALDGFVVMTEQRLRPAPPVDPAELARYEEAEAADAIGAIVERAKATRVVILNETHDNPRDRAFVLAVAEALRPLGYTHYAAETLANWGNDDQKTERLNRLVTDGYPRRDTGYYSSEPMFGWLLRGVIRLGYQPVSYEFSPSPERAAVVAALPMLEQIAERERAQAENLARAIAEAGPEAKFLIHVGYSHAAERPLVTFDREQEWMAAQFAKLSGIDPLTIDQTGLSEFSQTRSLHAALAPRLAGKPAVFLAAGGPVVTGTYAEAMDLQVVHPPIATVGGRPDWLQRTGRKAIPIPDALLPDSGRRLIQAFAAHESADAIPVDQVLVRAGDAPPLIYVPAGTEIRWVVQEDR